MTAAPGTAGRHRIHTETPAAALLTAGSGLGLVLGAIVLWALHTAAGVILGIGLMLAAPAFGLYAYSGHGQHRRGAS